jgi:glycosyltransferase involved in cell wall biosynthesis
MEPVRRVSVFLPAFNEVKNLEGAVADIVWAADGVLAEYEILVVNDGSTDGTRELADRLAHENPRVRALHQPRNMGIAAGYERALDEAKLHRARATSRCRPIPGRPSSSSRRGARVQA